MRAQHPRLPDHHTTNPPTVIPIPPHKHGSSAYWARTHGCPDPKCRLRAADEQATTRKHRAKHRTYDHHNGGWVSRLLSSDPPGIGEGPWHGTENGYVNYGCRCVRVPGTTREGCGPVGRDARNSRRRKPTQGGPAPCPP